MLFDLLYDPELLMHVARLKKIGKKVIFDSHENTYEQIKIKTYIPGIVRGFVANKYLKKETKACFECRCGDNSVSRYRRSFF